MTPLVSIIMPSYQTAAWIGAAIASVRAQTFPDWELLIVDDGSRDDSLAVIERAAEAELGQRILLTRHAGGLGAARARNLALAAARGRYVAFLDSDDLWYPGKLAAQLDHLRATGGAISHHAFELIDEGGAALDRARHPPAAAEWRQVLAKNPIGCSSAMIDTALTGARRMPDIAKRQDHGLWLAILGDGHQALGLDRILGMYRLRANSVSSNKLSAARFQWRLYRDVVGLSRLRAAGVFLRYAAGHLLGPGRDRPMDAAERQARVRAGMHRFLAAAGPASSGTDA